MSDRIRTKYIVGTPAERFWPKVDQDGPLAPLRPELGRCWLWLAGVDSKSGTPMFSYATSKTMSARRWLHEQINGPLATGLVIQGVCGTPSCVNTDHAKAMTKAEGASLQAALVRTRGGQRRPVRCRQGLHDLPPSGPCRPCRRARECARRKPRTVCKYGHAYPDATTTIGKRRPCPACQNTKPGPKLCSTEGCGRKNNSGGYCEKHGPRRVRKTSTVEFPYPQSVADRFWPRVNKNGPSPLAGSSSEPCWVWSGGDTFVIGGRGTPPRRWAWIDANGPLPPDTPLVLSKCRNDRCVNPDHAFAGTRKAANALGNRDRCGRGHLYNYENTMLKADGVRVCRACRRMRALAWRTANPDLQAKRSLRAYLRSAGNFQGIEYLDILQRDPCCYCGKPSESIDHINPIASGGDSHWMNLTAACKACNSSKRDGDLLSFMLRKLS